MELSDGVKNGIKWLIDTHLSDWKEWISDEVSSVCLTVATNNDGTQWSYQTGDNSYTGGAYSLPHWSVAWFNDETTAEELYDAIMAGFAELF